MSSEPLILRGMLTILQEHGEPMPPNDLLDIMLWRGYALTWTDARMELWCQVSRGVLDFTQDWKVRLVERTS